MKTPSATVYNNGGMYIVNEIIALIDILLLITRVLNIKSFL